MDCKTARMLIDFARPQPCELGPEEAGALEGHLDHCPDCHGLAGAERRFDKRLSQAMSQVEVPTGLREQLLSRLESERGDWNRRRFAHGMRLAAAAAAILLLGWAGWRWIDTHTRRPLDLEQVEEAVNNESVGDRRTYAEAALKRLGVPAPLTPHLNYNLLIAPPGMAELPGVSGQRAAMLVFAQGSRSATVYLVATEKIPEDAPRVFGGGTYKVEVLHSDGEPYAFLVVHDGDSIDWLRPPEPPAT